MVRSWFKSWQKAGKFPFQTATQSGNALNTETYGQVVGDLRGVIRKLPDILDAWQRFKYTSGFKIISFCKDVRGILPIFCRDIHLELVFKILITSKNLFRVSMTSDMRKTY